MAFSFLFSWELYRKPHILPKDVAVMDSWCKIMSGGNLNQEYLILILERRRPGPLAFDFVMYRSLLTAADDITSMKVEV